MIERLNNQTNPELTRLALGDISLTYTAHAIDRCLNKNIHKLNRVKITSGQVVEIEREWDGKSRQYRTVKLVVRFASCGNYDTVLVIRPLKPGLFLVVTCWKNHKDDTHATLNKERLGKVS